MKKKSIVIAAVSLTVALLLLWLLQLLVVPKYMTETQEGALIAEYYENAENNDVVFIGDCEVYENFSPITLWEEYGITSYIRGSAQQLIWQSYYLMEETFQYETPKVIVFNVLSMKYSSPKSTGSSTQREAYNRMTLDGMRWSMSKYHSIQASMTIQEQETEAFWMYLFPLLRYHDRWSELTAEDWLYWLKKDTVSHNGYLMQVGINPVNDSHIEPPLVDYDFAGNCYAYLDRMVELCEKNGTKLILIKAPSLSPVWWDEWDKQITAYAQNHGLMYINFLNHQDEIGLDWDTDTYDTGLHLNVYGAEKLSVYFGQILSQECGLEDHRSDTALSALWGEKVAAYNAQKEELEATRTTQQTYS